MSCYLYEYNKNHAKDNIVVRGRDYDRLKQYALSIFNDKTIVEEKMTW